jgi:hypothetical protein
VNAEELDSYWKRVTQETFAKTEKSMVSIYGVGSEEHVEIDHWTECVGTGFLVDILSAWYLFTARHVIADEFKVPGRIGLSFSAGRTGEEPLRVNEAQQSLDHTEEIDDVLVFRLTDEQKMELERIGQITPLSIWELEPGEFFEKDLCLVAGYPIAYSSTVAKNMAVYSTLLPYSSTFSDRRPDLYSGFEDWRHIAVEYELDGNIDPTGKAVRAPVPVGASGGCLWNLNAVKKNPDSWSVDGAKLVGICRRWYGDHSLIGATRISRALEVTAKKYPELVELFDELFPQGWRAARKE